MAEISQETPRSNRNIQAQIEQKRLGNRKYVLHGGALCSKCYENPPRPGQRYCGPCHAADQSKRQRAQRAELKQLRSISSLTPAQESEGLNGQFNARTV